MTTAELFAATSQPRNLVGRQEHLDHIYDAIAKGGTKCRVVLIEGDGGLGKTRLLEEVMRRLDHPTAREMYGRPLDDPKWAQLRQKVAVADVLDFTDTQLQTPRHFIEALGEPDTWDRRVRFDDYQIARDRLHRLVDFGMAYTLVKSADAAAEQAFWRDYENAARERRLVIPLDTTEQLAIVSSQWLLDRDLLTPEDLVFSTQQWLVDCITAGKFKNTTLIVAGRGKEGKRFFDTVKSAAERSDSRFEIISVQLKPFNLHETRAYFEALQYDWQMPDDAYGGVADNIRYGLEALLGEEERVKVLWYYTGGQPVRLALYTDILFEGQQLPEPLTNTYSEALARTNGDTREASDNLAAARREIEREFVDLLFRRGATLQGQIMQLLVRTPRGLTSEQIHYALDSTPSDSPANWQPDMARLQEIDKELMRSSAHAIVRRKAGERIGLQDEVYRIYAERMLANSMLQKEEIEARQRLYSVLQRWAKFNLEKLRRMRIDHIRDDLAKIRIERPSKALSIEYPRPTPKDGEVQALLAAEIRDAELEYLHYSLMLDPDTHFNDTYFSLAATGRASTYDETAAVMQQAELWRVLNDDDSMAFVPWRLREAARKRGETSLDVLRRAAEQDDAVQWIMRFIFSKQYERAIEFADAIEEEVSHLVDENERHSWIHTVARSERICWQSYAYTFTGDDLSDVVDRLRASAKELQELTQHGPEVVVHVENQEQGFIGHPAYPRLIFTLANIHNFIGYAQVSLGDFRAAVQSYTISLRYFRDSSVFENMAVQAIVLNNLSRALVELGKKRSVRVCRDGLAIRVENLGQLLPIAYSYNTLALILNDLRHPQEAYEAAERALAITKYVDDARAMGLVLLQVGEALRRLANSAKLNPFYDPAEEVYLQAERALQQAHEIFSASDASGESIRLVEAKLELGSLYRDWVGHSRDDMTPSIRDRRHGNALDYLQQAREIANRKAFVHLELDALVNIGAAHYVAGRLEEAEETLTKAQRVVSRVERHTKTKARLTPRGKYPDPAQAPNYVFKQMSKMYNIAGQIAFRRFENGVEEVGRNQVEKSKKERQQIVHDDAGLQKHLRAAAEAFVLSPVYAQFYAPGSAPLSTTYDDLYEYAKKLNQTEMVDFFGHVHEWRLYYRIARVKLENFGDVEGFLQDCFGDYFDSESIVHAN